jgi:hypothetical protein
VRGAVAAQRLGIDRVFSGERIWLDSQWFYIAGIPRRSTSAPRSTRSPRYARAATQSALNGLFLGLGAVALLVGAIGVANIMVISVLERRSEIGLRRALGATRGHTGQNLPRARQTFGPYGLRPWPPGLPRTPVTSRARLTTAGTG